MIPGTELQLRDMNKEGYGTLWAKGPNIMMGYYKDPEKTKEVIDENGWFNTEDIGYIDEDGYFFMSGRAKNIIVRPNGENIYPEQIESVINQHEAVMDSLMMEIDGKLVARIHLDYELIDKMFKAENAPEAEVRQKIADLLEEMRVDVNSQISSFSRMVKFIEQIEPFVKTPTKKIKRYLYAE